MKMLGPHIAHRIDSTAVALYIQLAQANPIDMHSAGDGLPHTLQMPHAAKSESLLAQRGSSLIAEGMAATIAGSLSAAEVGVARIFSKIRRREGESDMGQWREAAAGLASHSGANEPGSSHEPTLLGKHMHLKALP